MNFLALTWCGLQWTSWISFTSPDIAKLPTGPGVYRIRATGIDELFYIGQTGRNLRERLVALIRNTVDDSEHMPYNDPHTAAPSLWAWRDAEGLNFECSVASVPSTLTTEKREAFECSLLWRYRLEFGASTRCNHGRFHPHYVKSKNRSNGFRGGPLPVTEKNPAWGPSYPPLSQVGTPQDTNWMTLQWTPLAPLSPAYLSHLSDSPGVCKLLNAEKQLVLVELDQHIMTFLARLCQRTWRTTEISFSVVEFPPDIPPYQLREIKNDLIAGYYSLTRQPPQEQQRFN